MQNRINMNKLTVFLFAWLIFYILLLKQYLLWDQVIFFEHCYIVHFELDVVIIFQLSFSALIFHFSIFSTLVTTIFKRKLLKKLKQVSMSNERSWLVILDRPMVSIISLPYLGSCGKSLPVGLSLFISLFLSFRP